MVSILGTVIMLFGIYFVLGYFTGTLELGEWTSYCESMR